MIYTATRTSEGFKPLQHDFTAKDSRQADSILYKHCEQLAFYTKIESTVQLRSKTTNKLLREFKVTPGNVQRITTLSSRKE
jgi:hypothetical protein